MDITEIGEKFDKAKGIIITWFSILTRGPGAFKQIELEKSSTLFYALKFMLYMAFVDVLLHIPTAAKGGATIGKVFSEPLLVAETYIEYLMTGFILYGSMKILGGKGSLQPCIAAYCFLSAYLPIVSFFMLPTQTLIIPGIAKSAEPLVVIRGIFDQRHQLSTWELSGFLLSFLLTTPVFVVFFTGVFRVFRMLHELGRTRAVLAFILGLICSVLILAFFLEPFLSRIFQTGVPAWILLMAQQMAHR